MRNCKIPCNVKVEDYKNCLPHLKRTVCLREPKFMTIFLHEKQAHTLMRAKTLVPVGIHHLHFPRGGKLLSAGGKCRIVMNCNMCRSTRRSFPTSNLEAHVYMRLTFTINFLIALISRVFLTF